MRLSLSCTAAVLMAMAVPPAIPDPSRATTAERFRALGRDARWTLVASTPMAFPTYHPQGMVKIGETLYISSVEVTVRTRRFAQPVDGYDRDTGNGVGHLFKVGMDGRLLAHVRLGEGSRYHPGGIDFDGTHIWAPVAEYRPEGPSIVYRVDPQTMKVEEVFRFSDHIGGVVRNTDDGTLHGVSWGSRRFYRWTVGADGRVTNAGMSPASLRRLNPSHYIDYQDCFYAGEHRMLCGGVSDLRPSGSAQGFRLGGLDLIDLRDGRPLHQLPVMLWTSGGLPMTQNPIWLEPAERGLRAYFLPEDDRSTLYEYVVE